MFYTTRRLTATFVTIAPQHVYSIDATPSHMKRLGYTGREKLADTTTFGSSDKHHARSLRVSYPSITKPELEQQYSPSLLLRLNAQPLCLFVWQISTLHVWL